MVFSSLSFVVFFSIVCAVMALANTAALTRRFSGSLRELRHIILLVASYIFYGWWNWKCCFLMLLLTAVAWFCALGFEKTRKKLYVAFGVIFPLLILAVFKYFNFFVDSFCEAFGVSHGGAINIILPVGISFYTFQSLSYTIDVSRRKIPAEKSFVHTALFIAFFPQLVAGPIVKAGEFIPQLYEDRNISAKNLEAGVQCFVFGLFKKIVLADNISVFVDAVYANPAQFHALTLILAVAAYSIQIYCDFSGYSDMAVGCARCLGYELPRNFNLPYLSRNVSEFWKRWHISLSSWLMEYLYIPLGGNRKGIARTYVNLMLTMLIGGLWHGANWTFVVWGGLHGAALCLHKLFSRGRKESSDFGNGFIGALSVVCTFCFVSLCWVFFRSGSFSVAWQVLRGIFTWQAGVLHLSSWAIVGIGAVALGELAALIRCKRSGSPLSGFYPAVSLNSVWGLTVFFVFLGLTLGLGYTGDNPFIYFQF